MRTISPAQQSWDFIELSILFNNEISELKSCERYHTLLFGFQYRPPPPQKKKNLHKEEEVKRPPPPPPKKKKNK